MLCEQCAQHVNLVWGPAIRGAGASGREEHGFPPPSSPAVGGGLTSWRANPSEMAAISVPGAKVSSIGHWKCAGALIWVIAMIRRRSTGWSSFLPAGRGKTDTGMTGLPQQSLPAFFLDTQSLSSSRSIWFRHCKALARTIFMGVKIVERRKEEPCQPRFQQASQQSGDCAARCFSNTPPQCFTATYPATETLNSASEPRCSYIFILLCGNCAALHASEGCTTSQHTLARAGPSKRLATLHSTSRPGGGGSRLALAQNTAFLGLPLPG